MNRPSPLLLISAIIYFAAALPLLFAPEEVLTFAGAPTSIFLARTLLQVIGSAIFGFAMLNWLNRYARVGGIFGRPIVASNLAHCGTAALLLGKVASSASFSTPLAVVLVLYGSLAVAFGFTFFMRPATVADEDN